jgi:hypothetical protein
MPELLKTLAEYFGWAVPFGYAGLAYGFFLWIDKELSDEAKAALARTMSLKDYKSEQVASALVEVFDRIYTYPLLRWRAFFRSLMFTTVVSAIWVFEQRNYYFGGTKLEIYSPLLLSGALSISLLFNVLTDYLSLFVIRPLLIRSGTKPVMGLALAAVSGATIVLAANSLRIIALGIWVKLFQVIPGGPTLGDIWRAAFSLHFAALSFAFPALAVFVWLPLFALGIVIVRLWTPLSWIVGTVQWSLKEGKEHPLKAIGYVAAFVVFVGTVAGRAVFSAWA